MRQRLTFAQSLVPIAAMTSGVAIRAFQESQHTARIAA
jgi:hypothetical protein